MPGEAFLRERDHLAADVDSVDFAEHVGQGTRDAPGAASDLQHAHRFRILALANVAHVIQDLLAYGFLSGSEELLVAPRLIAGGDEIAGVFTRAGIPILPHFF